MSQPGQWEAKLGWLGSFLTGQDARHIEILNQETFVTVAWQGMGARRQGAKFSPEDLARPWMPYKQRPDSTNRSARLAALGQEIDRAQIDVASILEDEHGFVVTGSIGGRYENRCFLYSELAESKASPSAGHGAATASDDTEELVAPTKHNSPLMHRLHLLP